MTIPAVTAADLRAYVRWPDAVPGDFLEQHLAGAHRDVDHTLAGQVAAGMEADAAEAVICLAAASAFPFIHTFTQDGAASALRSAQMAGNRPNFQNADDQGKTILRLKDRAAQLLERLALANRRATETADEADTFGAERIFMGAI